MSKLPSIFSPKAVLEMEDEIVREIAGESEESESERQSSTQKLNILEAALQALRKLDKGKPKRKLSEFLNDKPTDKESRVSRSRTNVLSQARA